MPAELVREAVREFAGYVLRDQEGIEEPQLGALIEALRSGNGWIAPAIARIGTPAAIQALVDALKAQPESNTQLTYAIELAGEKALPSLVSLLRANDAVSPELVDVMCGLFAAAKGDGAADLLVQVAQDQELVLSNRRYAVASLGCVGPQARRAVPAIRQLAAADPTHFGDAVVTAIRKMGVPESVPLLVAALRENPSVNALRDIAALGANGRVAGPDLVELLSSKDASLRIGAARALGFIAYTEAVDALLPLLSDADDWRLVYVSAESLGRIGAPRAVPALEKVAAQHWFPPVARTAQRAFRVIKGEETYRQAQGNFAWEFYAFEHIADDPSISSQPALRPVLLPEPDRLTEEQRQALAYDIETTGFGEHGQTVTHSKAAPTCGLKVPDGYILGADRGEWGGELVYSNGLSRPQLLLEQNTHAIHRLPLAGSRWQELAT